MLTRRDVTELAGRDAQTTVSLFLPLRRAFDERKQNAIHLRNLLRRVAETVGADARALTAAREAAGEDPLDGRPDAAGLAVFADDEEARVVELPEAPEPAAHVGRGCRLSPLLPMLDRETRWFALPLDQERPTLLRWREGRLVEVDSPVMEKALERIRGETQLPANVGFHPSGSAAGGRPDARYHAQGESPDDYRQTELDRFALGVAKAVDAALADDPNAPLVPICEPRLLGLFRAHCKHAGLTGEAVTKSPAGLDEHDMREAARAVLRSHAEEARRAAVERAAEAAGDKDRPLMRDPELIAVAAEILDAPPGRLYALRLPQRLPSRARL